MWQFIRDKYERRLFAPRDTLDPAAEYLEKKKNGEEIPEPKSEKIAEEPPKIEPVKSEPKVAPELLDFDFGTNPKENPKEKAQADLFAAFEKDFSKTATKPSSAIQPKLIPTMPKTAQNNAKPNVFMTNNQPFVPNKYAALDFVQGPIISNNVYNIYNNVSMNISAGPGFNMPQPNRVNQPPIQQFVQFQPTYSIPPKSDSNDKAFKDILPSDF